MAISESAQIGITTAFVVMIVTNVIGNSLVVLTVIKTRSMRTPMNYLLVNLAIADMTVGVFIAPRRVTRATYIFSHAYTHPGSTAGTYVCKLLTGEVFTWVGALCSVYTLVAISIERYYAVMKPYSNRGRFTMNKFKLTAAACWIFATLWNLPLFIFSYFDEKNKFCNFAWPFKDFTKYHSTINAFVYGAIPIITMVCLYSRVTYRLWFNMKGMQASQQGTIKARKRVTKMVLTVSIIFCITWMPNIVTYPVAAYSDTPLYDAIHIVSIVCVTFNSSINPIIYSLQSHVFPKGKKRERKEKRSNTTTLESVAPPPPTTTVEPPPPTTTVEPVPPPTTTVEPVAPTTTTVEPPPTLEAVAPPPPTTTTVEPVAPPTTTVEPVAPPTTTVEPVAPTTTTVEPPPTLEAVAPPPPTTTTVEPVAPPPTTTTVEPVAPPSTTLEAVAPPPPTTTTVEAVAPPPPTTTTTLEAVAPPPPTTTTTLEAVAPPPTTTVEAVAPPPPTTTTTLEAVAPPPTTTTLEPVAPPPTTLEAVAPPPTTNNNNNNNNNNRRSCSTTTNPRSCSTTTTTNNPRSCSTTTNNPRSCSTTTNNRRSCSTTTNNLRSCSTTTTTNNNNNNNNNRRSCSTTTNPRSCSTTTTTTTTLEAVAPPPTTLEAVAPPPTTVEAVAPPPTTVEAVAPPPTTLEAVAPPPTTVEAAAPPPTNPRSCSITTNNNNRVEAVAPPPTVEAVAPPPTTTLEAVAPPPTTLEAVAPPTTTVEAVAPPTTTLEAVAPPPTTTVEAVAPPTTTLEAVYIFSRLYTHPEGIAGTYVCKLLTGEVFTWVGALCSVYTLVAISIERYYAVMKPYSNRGRFTMNKFKLTAAACWIFATLWNLPLFILSHFDEKNKFCNFAWPFKDSTKYHSTINAFVYGAIPIITMVCLYSRVTYRLWFKPNDQSAATQQGTIKARKRVTKMVLTVSIIFCITWMPNIVTYPLAAYSDTPLYDAVHIMSIVFVTFNSSINPIVYSLQSNMFRKNLWRVVTCGKHRVENESSIGNTGQTNVSTRPWAIKVRIIRIVQKHRFMRTPMNYLLLNLAVSDIMVAVFLIPRYVLTNAFTHPEGVVGTYMCKFLTGEVLTWVGALSSVYSLVAISVERYYAVMMPHCSKSRFTVKKFKVTAAACWIFATLWNLPLFIFSYFDEKNKFCNFAWPFKDFTKYHSTINAFVYGAIPISIMVCLYSRVTHRLWIKNDQIRCSPQQGTIKARKRVTKMVLTVSIIFCITWMPNIVTYPVSAYSDVSLYDAVHIFSIACMAFNSSVNPIIYSLQSNMFRKNLKKALCCIKSDKVGAEIPSAAWKSQTLRRSSVVR
ncbi:hypothetical protein QZH41_013730, partial [Actinostola sp. cb2023]